MDKTALRKPENSLPFSVRFAKEYLRMLCEMQEKYSVDKIQESNDLVIVHRALWTSLIIEVGRIFDTYESKDKKVISYKKLEYLKSEVDKLHSQAIIGRVLQTRKTFTAHWSRDKSVPISAAEICDSNLEDILNKLSELPVRSDVK